MSQFVNTLLHGVGGCFRFVDDDGLAFGSQFDDGLDALRQGMVLVVVHDAFRKITKLFCVVVQQDKMEIRENLVETELFDKPAHQKV